MPIAIDGSRLLTKNPTGVEVYCQNIINGLLVKFDDLILYTPQPISDLPKKNQQILNWPLKKFWSQIRLGFELLIHPPTVFFSPGYVIPWLALFNKKTKKIVTIHDLGFVYTPESYSLFQKWFLKLTTKQAVRYAHKIITAAKATKDDLIKYFNCPEEKVIVTYFGHNQDLAAHGPQFHNRKKQILFLGRIEEKKNINNLIKAFQIFYQKHPDYKLILAGKPGRGFKNFKFQISNFKFIDYKGYINQQTKIKLLQESSCLVLVSKNEGFGFPLLEAFSYNLPVLASDIQVLKEIGAAACLYAQSNSITDIAQKFEKIATDQDLRQELIRQGQARVKDFDWQKCVNKTWQTCF